ERAQPVLPPRQQDELPAAGSELVRDRRADAARRPRDDRYTAQRQTRRWRDAENVRPPASVATASSVCGPRSAKRASHEPVKTSETALRSTSICLPSTRNRTDRIRRVELATTTRPTVLETHSFSAGETQVTAGPVTPVIETGRNAVFGRMLSPTPLTFFASW